MRILRHAIAVVLLAGIVALGQANQASNPPQLDNAKIIQFLSTTISWYHQRASEQKLATDPADLTFLQENARVADQTVQQAFDYARSVAQLQARRRTTQQNNTPQEPNTQYQRLNDAVQKVEQQIQNTNSQLQTSREQLTKASPTKRRVLQPQIDELQSELGLLNARHDALQTL